MSMPWPALLAAVWADTGSEAWLGPCWGLADAAVCGAVRRGRHAGRSAAAARRAPLVDGHPGRAAERRVGSRWFWTEPNSRSAWLCARWRSVRRPSPAAVAVMPRLARHGAVRLTNMLVTAEVTAFVVGPAIGGLVIGLGLTEWSIWVAAALAIIGWPLLHGLGDAPAAGRCHPGRRRAVARGADLARRTAGDDHGRPGQLRGKRCVGGVNQSQYQALGSRRARLRSCHGRTGVRCPGCTPADHGVAAARVVAGDRGRLRGGRSGADGRLGGRTAGHRGSRGNRRGMREHRCAAAVGSGSVQSLLARPDRFDHGRGGDAGLAPRAAAVERHRSTGSLRGERRWCRCCRSIVAPAFWACARRDRITVSCRASGRSRHPVWTIERADTLFRRRAREGDG